MKTFPTAERAEGDAPGFVEPVARVVAGLVFRYRPQLVCCVRIRRWFDHRWLEFSGKGRVFFESLSATHPNVALDEFHQEQLTFPPFAPTRVAAEHHWDPKDSVPSGAAISATLPQPVQRNALMDRGYRDGAS